MKIKIDFKVFLLIFCYLITNKIRVFSVILFFILIHELAHILSGIILGLKPKKINFTLAGFSIEFEEKIVKNYISKSKTRLKNKIIIDLSGPIVNLILSIIFILLRNPDFTYANLLIFLVNIMPILPLDGGRVLKNILLYKYTFRTVNSVIVEISRINLIILTLIGSIIIVHLKNPLIVIFIIYLWGQFIKEKHYSNMIKNMYNIISKELL